MPTLSFSSNGPLTANVHLDGTTTREVVVTVVGDGVAELELGGVDVGARLIGRLDVLHQLVIEAESAIARLRGVR